MSQWVHSLLEGVADKEAIFPLRSRSSMDWARHAISDLNSFICDHAANERKASATCMSFVAKYTDKPEFVEAMIQVALEELEHFHRVYRIMRARGLLLVSDDKDEYVNALLKECQGNTEARFLDRLLIYGIIEARACERFDLIGKALAEGGTELELSQFYLQLSRDEARHFGLFLRYGLHYFSEDLVAKRLNELLDREAEILGKLPWRHALH
jgi:tRNA 2-(methylsulfanyl)-N6-isopentenyladenosine37 hydroxylase